MTPSRLIDCRYDNERPGPECADCDGTCPGIYTGPMLQPVAYEDYAAMVKDRDRWVRLFNRLEAAISHHHKATDNGFFATDADAALYAARARILKAAAKGPDA